MGGLGVFGSALITSTAGYTLPTSLNLGVNGKIGAKQYCDEKGNNCVSTLGGTYVNAVTNTGGSSGDQMIAGWPNKILCEGGGQKIILFISQLASIGFPESIIKYPSLEDISGNHTRIYFKYATGDYLSIANKPETASNALDACVAKGNIKNQRGFN